MRAGQLDRRITLEAATDAQDETGAPIEVWTPIGTVWASRRDTSGRERVHAGAETAIADAVFRIRWRAGLTAKMRLIEGDEIWDITALGESIQRRVWIDLTCTRVLP